MCMACGYHNRQLCVNVYWSIRQPFLIVAFGSISMHWTRMDTLISPSFSSPSLSLSSILPRHLTLNLHLEIYARSGSRTIDQTIIGAMFPSIHSFIHSFIHPFRSIDWFDRFDGRPNTVITMADMIIPFANGYHHTSRCPMFDLINV